jgi:hypothetical protein
MTTIFSSGWENSNGTDATDGSAWTGTWGNPSVTTSPVHHGTYALVCSTGSKYVAKMFTDAATVFVRAYLRITQEPDASLKIDLMKMSGDNADVWQLSFYKASDGTKRLMLTYNFPNQNTTAYHDFSYAVNTWYSVEVKAVMGSANGEYRVYIDGQELIAETGVNTTGRDDMDYFSVGRLYGSGGSVYVDCVVIADSYIGPEGAPASQLAYTAGTSQSINTGVVSSVVTVQVQDSNGNPVTTGATVNLSSSSGGGTFYSDSGGNNQITSVVISSGQSTGNFYYKDTAAGTPTLTASATGLTSAQTQFTIQSSGSGHEATHRANGSDAIAGPLADAAIPNISASKITSGTLNLTSGLTLNNSAGTSGQVLTSSGSGNTPTWETMSHNKINDWDSATSAFLTTVTPSNLNGSGSIPSGWIVPGARVSGDISGNAASITGDIPHTKINDWATATSSFVTSGSTAAFAGLTVNGAVTASNGTGTTGQVLTSSGSGNAPYWQTISGSGGFITSIAQGQPFNVSPTGVLSLNISSPMQISSNTLSMTQANSSTNGYLSSADWTTFNNKQNALTTGNLNGTEHQVNVSDGTGAVIGSGVTLSLPQNIHTGASPTFAGLTVKYLKVGDEGEYAANSIQFEPHDGFHRIAFQELHFWDWSSDPAADMMILSNGQLKLPYTGNSGGLVFGNDTNLYRVTNANILSTDNSFAIGGYQRFYNTGDYLHWTGDESVVWNQHSPSQNKKIHVFCSDVSPYDQGTADAPLLYVDQSIFAENDIMTYGSLGTMSDPQKLATGRGGGGALTMGHGWTHPTNDMPMIYLADYPTFGTLWIKANPSDPDEHFATNWPWGNMELGNLTAHGTVTVYTWANVGTVPLYKGTGNTIGYNQSTLRVKQDITDLTDCSWFYDLKPVNFDWKDQNRAKEGRQFGLIAEEVNALCPQLTWLDSEGKPEGVHYEWLGVPMIVEIKKLRNRVEALENQIKQNRAAA